MSDLSGADLSGNVSAPDLSGNIPVPPGPIIPEPVSLASLLNSLTAKKAQEDAHKVIIQHFIDCSVSDTTPALLYWATKGFPDYHILRELNLDPPAVCSDGQSRDLLQYIFFLTEDPIDCCIDKVKAKFADIDVSYQYNQNSLRWVVRKMN